MFFGSIGWFNGSSFRKKWNKGAGDQILQTDRQTDRQIDRQPDRQIDRQRDRQIESVTDRQIDRQKV